MDVGVGVGVGVGIGRSSEAMLSVTVFAATNTRISLLEQR
jgi:hypothetical protein